MSVLIIDKRLISGIEKDNFLENGREYKHPNTKTQEGNAQEEMQIGHQATGDSAQFH